jgi:hypothetical protein
VVVRSASESIPTDAASVRALAVEAWRRAEAMGLVQTDERRPERPDIAALIRSVRAAGLARGAALRFDNVDAPSVDEIEALLRIVIAALEASPVPVREWPVLGRVFDPDQLASLLGISVSSLRRYASGERETPDEVAARVHGLALIVGDLSGAYNDVGIRRWFDRKRTALDGKAPSALLAGEWNPDDAGPQKVRDLARSLIALSAT